MSDTNQHIFILLLLLYIYLPPLPNATLRPMMVLVQRLTLLAANLLDGAELVKAQAQKLAQDQAANGHPSSSSSAPPSAFQLSAAQREYAVL